MNLLNASTRFVETLSKTGAVAGGSGIIILMLLATAGAIGRKCGHPVFLGMAYVALQGGHINVTLFTQRLSTRAQTILDTVVMLLSAAVFGLLTWSSWGLAWKWFLIREVRLGAFPWPIWPFRFLFVVGMGLIALQLIFGAVNLIHKAWGREA